MSRGGGILQSPEPPRRPAPLLRQWGARQQSCTGNRLPTEAEWMLAAGADGEGALKFAIRHDGEFRLSLDAKALVRGDLRIPPLLRGDQTTAVH